MAEKSYFRARPLVNGLFPALLVFIGIAAYSNSFSGPFIFDDVPNIVENPNIRQLWPLTVPMSAPALSGLGGRFLLSLSFALNYAFGKHNVWGYHFVNLTIHILAALTLYGIVRRTLLCGRLNERFGRYSAHLACITAAIWLVHPIQTESVTYIVQRAESLMGLFYLLTVYAAIRSMQSKHSLIWPITSVIFCILGMATKEVMVTAPLIILFYDRTFEAGSFRDALKKRWPLYLCLAFTWLALAASMAFRTSEATVGFSIKVKPFDYALNQFISVAKYIKLSFWPDKLCLYYSAPVVRLWNLIIPPMLLILAIVSAAMWGFAKNRTWSYPLVWFFAILVPSSSFVPIADLIFEHRIYLPIAGLAVLVVITGFLLLQHLSKSIAAFSRPAGWLGICISTAVIAVLTTRTIYRNSDYRSALSIWQSVVKAAPNSYKGYVNLGSEYRKLGQNEWAIECYFKALKINPRHTNAHYNLGSTFKAQGKLEKSAYHFRQVLLREPNDIESNFNLGSVFQLQNKLDLAVERYNKTLTLDPNHINANNNLGTILALRGKPDEAIKYFETVLKIDPNNSKAYNNFAYTIAAEPNALKQDIARAVGLAQKAAELTDFNDPEVLDTLADCYSKDGKTDLAVKAAQKALELAENANNNQLADQLRNRLTSYKNQKP